MINDDSFRPGSAKVYCSGGVWQPDPPEELRLKHAEPVPYSNVEKPVRNLYVPKGRPFARSSARAVKERRAPKLKAVPKARQKLYPGVTLEAIRTLQDAGMSYRKISEHFGCSINTIYKKMRVHRRRNAASVEMYAALRVCACGGRKLAKSKVCSQCNRTAVRKRSLVTRRPS